MTCTSAAVRPSLGRGGALRNLTDKAGAGGFEGGWTPLLGGEDALAKPSLPGDDGKTTGIGRVEGELEGFGRSDTLLGGLFGGEDRNGESSPLGCCVLGRPAVDGCCGGLVRQSESFAVVLR